MGYATLARCVADLERTGQLIRVAEPLDGDQEVAAVHRRVSEAGGPALLFERVKGSKFPAASNLFGTTERLRYIFRDTVRLVETIMKAKAEPPVFLSRPGQLARLPFAGLHALPRHVRRGPVTENECAKADLPRVVNWPDDGGAFVTLPVVYSHDPASPGWMKSNMGMYRVQLTGNDYADDEVGLHYQIHRGLGVHHSHARERGERLRVNIAVGGPPALAVSAVMPLPEGMPEAAFAGVLAGRRLSWVRPRRDATPFPAEADFVIAGEIADYEKPEGPFGDHLGYYAKTHDFPVLKVDKIYHRRDAIWPFTVVGRPPQEDTAFGEFIHDLTSPVIPTVLPGVVGVHAVDAAGVHPLLLAVGSERYTPYQKTVRPQELLTQASAILGQGQLSLAKYLLILDSRSVPEARAGDEEGMFRLLLQRFDPTRDLHFHTRTTVDTLDYSGTGFNQGSKLVWAAVGEKRRELATATPADLTLPEGFSSPRVCRPGILAVSGPRISREAVGDDPDIGRFLARRELGDALEGFPLVVVTDDAAFTAASFRNFLWETFTRSDPAADVYGFGQFVENKHWGCRGPVVIDARLKPRQAPPLVEDPAAARKADSLAAKGGPLHGVY